MAIGVWGMISVGSDTLQTVQEGEYTAERGKMFEMNSYVFLFTIVAGLIVLLYSVVSSQAESASSRRAIA
jgi:formate hydrogenlyase subunit 3/multisubunit Na+/H+ antiporter MnhD subunit